MIGVGITWAVADQAATRSKLAELVDHRYRVTSGQLQELSAKAQEERIGLDYSGKGIDYRDKQDCDTMK